MSVIRTYATISYTIGGEMKLYICQTLDGYIARKDGSIDFLSQFDDELLSSPDDQLVNTYQNFMDGIENIVEGYKTFDQLREIGYVDQYSAYNHYVVTNAHRGEVSEHVTEFVDFDRLEQLELDDDKTFLVGGSKIITEAFKRQLVSTVIITQLPIFLGEGINLFDKIESNPRMEIVDMFNDTRFYQVEYKVTYPEKI